MADSDEKKRGIVFEPTINLGHVLTFFSLIGAVIVGWNTLDKRIVALEEAKVTQTIRDESQDKQHNLQDQYMTQTLIDIKRAVERLNDKLERSESSR